MGTKPVRITSTSGRSNVHPLTRVCPGGLQVKHTLVEIYHATLGTFRKDLQAIVKAAPLPVLHANVDVWKSKISGESFIGTSGSIRVFRSCFFGRCVKGLCISYIVRMYVAVERGLFAVHIHTYAAELSTSFLISDKHDGLLHTNISHDISHRRMDQASSYLCVVGCYEDPRTSCF